MSGCYDLDCEEGCCNFMYYCPNKYNESYPPEYSQCMYYYYDEPEEEEEDYGLEIGLSVGGIFIFFIIIPIIIVYCIRKN